MILHETCSLGIVAQWESVAIFKASLDDSRIQCHTVCHPSLAAFVRRQHDRGALTFAAS